MYKAAIFDMDGTLINTIEDLTDSVNEVMKHYNLSPLDIEEVKICVGNGARKLMERIFDTTDENFINDALKFYDGCYKSRLLNKTKPYAGIVEFLTALNEKNIPVAICTNKQHFAAVELAKKIFPTIKFAEVIGDAKKPNPARALEIAKKIGVEPAEVAYFGDSSVDMQTAVDAGFLPVGVTWGFRPAIYLKDSGAKMIIHRTKDIFKLIDFGG